MLGAMLEPPLLLHFRVSHFNEKVRWALDYKQWPHVRRTMVPGFHIVPIRVRTGQNKVPVLRLDGTWMTGSTAIITELERRRPDPPLVPSDRRARERALELVRVFDERIAPDLRRLFWSFYFPHAAAATALATDGASSSARTLWRLSYPMLRPVMRANMGASAKGVAAAAERLPSHFERLEAEIGASGYLVGDHFSIADLTAAAIFAAVVRPAEFSYALPEPVPPELDTWQAPLRERAGGRWVRDIYARHRGPSFEIV
jgi:glutathione S-transferase